jgi:hypothetical protein
MPNAATAKQPKTKPERAEHPTEHKTPKHAFLSPVVDAQLKHSRTRLSSRCVRFRLRFSLYFYLRLRFHLYTWPEGTRANSAAGTRRIAGTQRGRNINGNQGCAAVRG